uniref:CUB domain-containing protein n=1 Tax=Echeneis naucrates TaxID=173247 RepID=A0A665U215_ECHNA
MRAERSEWTGESFQLELSEDVTFWLSSCSVCFCSSAADSCGGGLDVESGGYFTSPGYPFDYLPSERCVWVITAQEPDQKILLTFNAYFHLEDKDCK